MPRCPENRTTGGRFGLFCSCGTVSKEFRKLWVAGTREMLVTECQLSPFQPRDLWFSDLLVTALGGSWQLIPRPRGVRVLFSPKTEAIVKPDFGTSLTILTSSLLTPRPPPLCFFIINVFAFLFLILLPLSFFNPFSSKALFFFLEV